MKQKVRQIRRKQKVNNKGYSMVSTLVAISFVTILGVVVLGVSSVNLKTKYLDKKNKTDFYSAEGALEDIYNGIGLEVSNLVGISYAEVMREAANGEGVVYENEIDAYAAFQKSLKKRMDITFLNDGTDRIDLKTKMEQYITMNTGVDLTDKSKKRSLVSAPTNEADRVRTKLDAYGNVCQYTLQNISVTYYDGRGNRSSITTDIVVDFPYIGFFKEPDSIFDYAIVANEGLDLTNGNMQIRGNVYAGANIHLQGNSATLAGKYIVAKGDILANDGTDLSIHGLLGNTEYANIWAESIKTVQNGINVMGDTNLRLVGNTFLANDLELNVERSKARLEGAFYGYNNKTYVTRESADSTDLADHTKSSAIIVNGRECSLDLSGLNTLIVAGKAYIDFKSRGVTGDSVEFATGESIALKSNQFVYLMPSEYLQCPNPISKQDADFLASQAGVPVEEWCKKIVEGEEFAEGWFAKNLGMLHTNPIQVNTVTRDGKAYYYFYIQFADEKKKAEYLEYILSAKEEDAANPYIAQALTMKQKLEERIFENAMDGITINDAAGLRVYGQANLLKTEGTGGDGVLDLQQNTDVGEQYADGLSVSVEGVAEASQKLNRRYEWLYTLLENKENFALNAVIPEIKEEDYRAKYHKNGAGLVYKSNDTENGRYLPLSQYVDFYQIKQKSKNVNPSMENNKPIIRDGDCVVDTSYQGVILCNGNVTIQNGAIVKGLVLATGKVTVKDGAHVISDRGIVQAILDGELREEDANSNDDYAAFYFVDYQAADADIANSFTRSTNYLDWMSYENYRKGDR